MDSKNDTGIRRIYAHKKFVRSVATLMVFAWLFWLLVISLIVIGNIFYNRIPYIDEYIFEIIGFVAIYSAIVFVLLTRPICEACGKKVFAEPVQVHPNFIKKKWFGGWATIVLSLVRRRDFVCMHCGKYIINKQAIGAGKAGSNSRV